VLAASPGVERAVLALAVAQMIEDGGLARGVEDREERARGADRRRAIHELDSGLREGARAPNGLKWTEKSRISTCSVL